ncbi:hypothetical protein FPZ43_10190 [Mucilaginibacter pallidiroseus]|uniref:Outer membrane protein beta-barrel domain-containing protein n=1 Tax=Mucilaginibacter pallidiroseus TaxID=2599295 RepID=A0A563UD86_9SPHI|nr:hypothetical protein [Mucilaginibacter pallidiroseus]TWR29318.1 hypothetical protein FPZ43_10190 [Mucilaginibacter pallidiroseus]
MLSHSLTRTHICAVLLTLFFVTLISFNANAQRSPGMNADGDVLGGSTRSSSAIRSDGWQAAINIGYESPLGELKDIYNGSPTYGINVLRKKDHLLFSGTIDYRNYKPKYADFSYIDEDGYYYSSKYSRYRGIGLYLGVAYEISFDGQFSFYGGLNGGFILTSYKSTINSDFYSGTYEVSNYRTNYVAPKLGFTYMLTNNVSIGLEAKYSLGVTGATYNTRDGGTTEKGFNSYAGNMFLTYCF